MRPLVCAFVRTFVPPLAHPARPEAQSARSERHARDSERSSRVFERPARMSENVGSQTMGQEASQRVCDVDCDCERPARGSERV